MQVQANVDRYKSDMQGLGFDQDPYSEERRRELQGDQLAQYQKHLSAIRDGVHEALRPHLLKELIGMIKTYVSEVDHQSLAVLRYFTQDPPFDNFDGGTVCYRSRTSCKPKCDEYAAPVPFIRPYNSRCTIQILMHHRISPKFQWIQQTMRSWLKMDDLGAERMVDAADNFMSLIHLEMTVDVASLSSKLSLTDGNQLHIHRLFIPHSLYDSAILDKDRDFLSLA